GAVAVSDQNSPSFPGEPVYPYALNPGDPPAGLDVYDLTSNFSIPADLISYNNALSCVGFPNPCGSPKALPTSAGNLYINPDCCFIGLSNASFSAQIQPLIPFSAFNTKAEVTGATNFQVNGRFSLGTGSDGINPLVEVVTLQVGTYSVAIPSGSFTKTPKGAYIYQGTMSGVALQVQISPLNADTYTFKAEGSGANLTGTSNPLTVGLTIWDDAGTTTVAPEHGSV